MSNTNWGVQAQSATYQPWELSSRMWRRLCFSNSRIYRTELEPVHLVTLLSDLSRRSNMSSLCINHGTENFSRNETVAWSSVHKIYSSSLVFASLADPWQTFKVKNNRRTQRDDMKSYASKHVLICSKKLLEYCCMKWLPIWFHTEVARRQRKKQVEPCKDCLSIHSSDDEMSSEQ